MLNSLQSFCLDLLSCCKFL